MLKIHLGCGRRFIPGFVHVDLAAFDHIDYQHDLRTLPMFGTGSADLIYCCHAFEYFDRIEAQAVLAEYVRVLRPGGTLRLAVPDFAALSEVYRQTGDLDRVVGPLFGRMAMADRNGNVQTIYHRTVYDRTSLERLLANAGLDHIRLWDWRQTEHAAVDDFSQAYYPHMEKAAGLLISLNLEGDKAT